MNLFIAIIINYISKPLTDKISVVSLQILICVGIWIKDIKN